MLIKTTIHVNVRGTVIVMTKQNPVLLIKKSCIYAKKRKKEKKKKCDRNIYIGNIILITDELNNILSTYTKVLTLMTVLIVMPLVPHLFRLSKQLMSGPGNNSITVPFRPIACWFSPYSKLKPACRVTLKLAVTSLFAMIDDHVAVDVTTSDTRSTVTQQ